MKVFISWSGQFSKNLAEALKQWLPAVIQVVKPYYSPDDISKGSRWANEISKELDTSKIGIICLTKENLGAPWIMFEAGALSKNIDKSKVVPLLFGIEPSDIEGPLVQFQAAKFSKTEMKKVVKMINQELGESALSSDVLESVFEMWWTKLETQVKEAEEKAKSTSSKGTRSERDLLEEVLTLTRELSINRRFEKDRTISPRAIEDLVTAVERITETAFENGYSDLVEKIRDLQRPLEYFIEETLNGGPGMRKDLYSRYRRTRMLLDEMTVIPEKPIIRIRKAKNPEEDKL
jgi:hypothetical protein